jgi:hypothetical protein
MLLRTMIWLALILAFAITPPAIGQTPDGQTPADEQACDKYKDEGARYGLCIAYCEAQDCDRQKPPDQSCQAIEERFIEYSVKKGYVMDGDKIISCHVTACTKDDVAYCGGRELDCLNAEGVCESVCSPQFEGFDSSGSALCSASKCKQKCS